MSRYNYAWGLGEVSGPAEPRATDYYSLTSHMEAGVSKLLRGLAAGWGAKKLGGGCISTILIFILLWWLLGHFNIFR